MTNKKAWIGLLVSAACLYLAFRQSDWTHIWAATRNARYGYFLAALPIMFLAYWLKALRWRYLLLPAGRPSLHTLFGATLIGYMALNVLPLRLGEFIRAYVLGRREGLSMSGVFATIVVERIFDGFTLLLMLLIPLFYPPVPLGPEIMAWVTGFAWLGLGIFGLASVVLFLIRKRTELIIGVIQALLGRWARLARTVIGMTRSFAAGLEAVANLGLFLRISFCSILIWLSYAAFYWVTLYAYHSSSGINAGTQAGPIGSIFVMVAIALGIMVPASPGFVGVFEWACILSLAAMGVEKSVAESYALTVHAYQFIPITLAGIIYLYVQGFSFKEIQTGSQVAHEELGPAETEGPSIV